MYYKYSILSELGDEIKGVEEGSLESVKKTLKEKKYNAMTRKLDEIGRNLGGWYGQIIKQNSLKK